MVFNGIEELYLDSRFDTLINIIAERKRLPADDLKQAAFSEMLSTGASSMNDCKAAVNRVAQVFYRQAKNDALLNSDDSRYRMVDDPAISELWEDRHVLRGTAQTVI